MLKRFCILISLLFILSGCLALRMPSVTPLKEKTLSGTARDKILLIDISGVIRDKKDKNIFGTETSRTMTARIKEELEKARGDKKIKALILRINTPGGGVTTADIIYHEIMTFKKETSIPVVAQFMDMAASGGYYIGVSADKIVAQPTSITGSIGVVAYNVNAVGLLDKIGIYDQTIKSGDKKDMASPMRDMTAEEREILQSIIDELYERFLGVIFKGRGGLIDKDRLREISDGRVYTAGQALKLKLIDRVGYMEDAVSYAKELAHIDEARVVSYAQSGSYRNNLYSGAPSLMPTAINLINIDTSFMDLGFGISFMYLWRP